MNAPCGPCPDLPTVAGSRHSPKPAFATTRQSFGGPFGTWRFDNAALPVRIQLPFQCKLCFRLDRRKDQRSRPGDFLAFPIAAAAAASASGQCGLCRSLARFFANIGRVPDAGGADRPQTKTGFLSGKSIPRFTCRRVARQGSAMTFAKALVSTRMVRTRARPSHQSILSWTVFPKAVR